MDRLENSIQINEEALAKKLANTPGLDLGKNGRLVRRPDDKKRDDRTYRIHFEWVCDDGVRYNLTTGPDAVSDFAKTRAFHQAFPDLGIRPVALIQIDGGGIAVLEHFEGRSLEQALASGILSQNAARTILDRLMDRLESQVVPVGMDDFLEEIETLREEIHACPVWGSIDLHFFDAIVFPFLKSTCEPSYLRRRWTTGDFIARNILVGASGDLRLIDCEFASQTVLSLADFQRFIEFSDVPAELREHVRARLPGDSRWWRIHFAIDQVCKLARVRRPDAFGLHAGTLLHRIWRDIQCSPSAPPPSQLFQFLGNLDQLAQHSNTLQLRYDELRAHSNLLQSRYDLITTHSKDLQTRYNELHAHSNALQVQYEALAKHARELQAVCDWRAAGVESAESARADLLHRIDRLKRPWLWLMRK